MATYTKPSEIKKRAKRQRITSLLSFHGSALTLRKGLSFLRTPRGILAATAILFIVVVAIGGIIMYNSDQTRKEQQAQEIADKKSKYGELTQAARAKLVSDYLAAGRYEEARDAITYANEPESKENLLLLALVHQSQQQYSEALEVLRKVESQHGSDDVLTEYIKQIEELAEGSDG